MDWHAKAGISSSVAALVAVLVSLAADYFGGRVAAAIGSAPHVAVIGSIGFFATLEQREFEVAMLSMSVGIFLNSIYVASMVLASKSWNTYCAGTDVPTVKPCFVSCRSIFVVVYSFVVFMSLVAMVLGLLRLKERSTTFVRACAVASFGLQALVGLLLVCCAPPVPKKNRRSHWSMVAARAAVTFAVFFLALYAARTVPVLGGILVNLPIMTTVVVASVWQSQGEAVAMSTCGPLSLGMLSPSAYAFAACELLPLLGAGPGAALAWLACVAGVSLPVLGALELWARRRRSRAPRAEAARDRPPGPAEGASASEGGRAVWDARWAHRASRQACCAEGSAPDPVWLPVLP